MATPRKKPAPARVVLSEDFFEDDQRFELLAAFCAEDEDKTRMRVIRIWNICFKTKCDEMSADDVNLHARWRGSIPFAVLMARSSLAELLPDGKFRVRGVKKRTKKAPSRAYKDLTPGQATSMFIATYCTAFKERWKTPPVQIAGRYLGAAGRMVAELGVERACQLVSTYLEMNDGYFLSRKHDLLTMESSLNSIAIKHDTGKTLSRADIRGMEQRESLLQTTAKATDWITE